jgi:hypothetical protein
MPREARGTGLFATTPHGARRAIAGYPLLSLARLRTRTLPRKIIRTSLGEDFKSLFQLITADIGLSLRYGIFGTKKTRMKTHTTNYINTFIEVAEDCPVIAAEIPPNKGEEKTAAVIQFEMIYDNPYQFTSDDVIFQVFAEKNKIKGKSQITAEREKFYSKGQPCLRSSPLTKRYGWGVHSNAEGKIAIYPVESAEYKKFVKDKILVHTKAMRSKRA